MKGWGWRYKVRIINDYSQSDPIEDADTIERINRDYPRPNSNNRQQNLDQ